VGIQNLHLGFERRLRPKVVGKRKNKQT
jgi:hypothetical protein